MFLAYKILTSLLYPFLFILIFIRKYFNKEHQIRYKEKVFFSHFNVDRKDETKLIWFHAASIGEFKSIIPIIEELIKIDNIEILITTTTLSSGNLAEKIYKKFDKIHHRFFPLDINFLIERFFKEWRPDRIILVDSEIWPNLILTAKRNKIPLALINARLTKKTFSRWMRFPNTAKKIFNIFDLCLASNNETKDYLKKLDTKNVYFNGNIKLISKIDEKKIKNLNADFLSSRRFWLAASTHKGEELFSLKVHKKIKEKYADILTIIAPRHINRSKEIYDLSNNLNLKTQLLNEGERISDEKEVIIINSFNILENYFKYAKSVFIGKSLLKELKSDSGQNPIDAAKLSCRVYHGPYVYNFEEIYEILKKNNIARKIETIEDLSSNLIKDLESPLKKETKISNQIEILEQKTLEETMKNLNNFIK